jgi:hypothetical protein
MFAVGCFISYKTRMAKGDVGDTAPFTRVTAMNRKNYCFLPAVAESLRSRELVALES